MNEKKNSLVKWIFLMVLLAGIIVIIALRSKIYAPEALGSMDNVLKEVIRRGLMAYVIISSGIIVETIVSAITNIIYNHSSNKTKTVVTLLRSLIKWVIIIAVIVLVLQVCGVDMTTLLAGLGLLALIIGLGAQQIIADVIAGFFIVFENEFKVGDIITIDGWRGTVSDIGIRVTKIVDTSGNVKIVNNSDIKTIVNLTSELSVAYLYVSIDYSEDLNKVELVLRDHLADIKEAVPEIIDGPYYKGVNALNSSSVDLMLAATCKESDIYQVKRDINRQIFLLFNQHNINIPFNQIVVSERNYKPTPYKKMEFKENKNAKDANQFVDEQSELSKNLEEEAGSK